MAINTSTFTLDSDAAVVTVATFRNQIEHLERKVRSDYGACVSDHERARWVIEAQIVGADLIAMTCSRATVADWERRERAIERSTKLVISERARAVSSPRDFDHMRVAPRPRLRLVK